MYVLIIGGNGFIGHALLNRMKNSFQCVDMIIYCLDDYSSSSRDKLQIDGVTYIEGCTSDTKVLNSLPSFQLVIHFGEYSRVNASFDEPGRVWESNLQGTTNILELCRQWQARLIYAASSATFNDNENLSPYSWSKSKMIQLIKNYNKWYGLDFTLCYFYNVYGPGQLEDGPYATVLGIFERCYREEKALPVVAPGTQRRYFTHIDDTINGVMQSILAPDTINSEMHLCSFESFSILEVARLFQSSAITMLPSRDGNRQQHLQSFSSDLLQTWKPQKHLVKYISQIIKR